MLAIVINDSGKYLGTIYTTPKIFKTLSHGYIGSGDVTDIDNGKRFFINLQLVEIGSKPVPGDSKDQKSVPPKEKR